MPAWVIMDNHYHWLLRTLKPNLVEGMSWLPKEALRRLLWKMSEFGGLRLLTYCVMGNHFRSLVQVPLKEEGMRQLEGADEENLLFARLVLLSSTSRSRR